MPAIPADVEGYLSTLIQQCWNKVPEVFPAALSFVLISQYILAESAVVCGGSRGPEFEDPSSRYASCDQVCKEKITIHAVYYP